MYNTRTSVYTVQIMQDCTVIYTFLLIQACSFIEDNNLDKFVVVVNASDFHNTVI